MDKDKLNSSPPSPMEDVPEAHLALLIQAAEATLPPTQRDALDQLLAQHPHYEQVLDELRGTWDLLDHWQAPAAPKRSQARFQAALCQARRNAPAPPSLIPTTRGPLGWAKAVGRAAVPMAAMIAVSLVILDWTRQPVGVPSTQGIQGAQGALTRDSASGARSVSGGLMVEGVEAPAAAVRAWQPSAASPPTRRLEPLAHGSRSQFDDWNRQMAGMSVGVDVRDRHGARADESTIPVEFVHTSTSHMDEHSHYVSPTVTRLSTRRSP